MDGLREYSTKWSKSDRERQINVIWYHLYVESKKIQWIYMQNRKNLKKKKTEKKDL